MIQHIFKVHKLRIIKLPIFGESNPANSMVVLMSSLGWCHIHPRKINLDKTPNIWGFGSSSPTSSKNQTGGFPRILRTIFWNFERLEVPNIWSFGSVRFWWFFPGLSIWVEFFAGEPSGPTTETTWGMFGTTGPAMWGFGSWGEIREKWSWLWWEDFLIMMQKTQKGTKNWIWGSCCFRDCFDLFFWSFLIIRRYVISLPLGL